MRLSVKLELIQRIGLEAAEVVPLHGGSIGEVYCAHLTDAREVVVKVDRGKEPSLDVEGFMLDYLGAHSTLPVPQVLHSSPEFLVMTMLAGSSHFTDNSEQHAAELLAELHGIRAEQFGLDRDTLIGSLHQPNPYTDSWIEFFRENRLLYMAGEAHRMGKLPKRLLDRIQNLAGALDNLLEEPDHPSLLHGDVWTTNVLADQNHITGFIDPAVYFGHPEIELAFIALFSTFGPAFFNRYNQLREIQPGFFEQRKDIYNLYPLLVHSRLFGGGYAASVDEIVTRFGF